MSETIKNNSIVTFLLVTSALLLVFTLRGAFGNFNNLQNLNEGIPNPAFESPHERSSYVLLLSMLYNRSISLTPALADFGFNDIGVHKGKLYSLFPPGVALVIAPLYFLGSLVNAGQLVAYMTVVLAALGIIFLIFRISTKVFALPEWSGAAAAFIFAFGTTAWSYSITIYQHIFTTLLILTGFYAAYLFRKEGKLKWGIVAGLIYIVSVAFDYTNLVLLSPLLIYMYTRQRTWLPVLTIGVAGLLTALYNFFVFGDWKTMSNPLPVYKLASPEALDAAGTVGQALGRFHFGRIFDGLHTLLISPHSGLFIFSPILIIGLIYVISLFRKSRMSREHLFFISIIVINIGLYSFFDDPAGGWSYGPRYLIPAMACFALFVGQWLGGEGRIRMKKVVTWIAFAISSWIALLGATVTNMIVSSDPLYVGAFSRGMTYTFHAILGGRTGSFFYHNFLAGVISVPSFFLILYLLTLIFFTTILLFDFKRKAC